MNEWVASQILEFKNLAGRRIASFEGVEMAFLENDGTGAPQFSHRSAPCLQFMLLYMRLADGAVVEVSNYQDDDEFGIRLEWRAPPHADRFEGIFRFRAVPELRTGLVESVTTSSNSRGNLSEVGLLVEGNEIRLVAGEAQEGHDDSLVFCRNDESVLVFSSADDLARIRWTR